MKLRFRVLTNYAVIVNVVQCYRMFGELGRRCQHLMGWSGLSCRQEAQQKHMFISIGNQGWQMSVSIPQAIQLLIMFFLFPSLLICIFLGLKSRFGTGVQFGLKSVWNAETHTRVHNQKHTQMHAHTKVYH